MIENKCKKTVQYKCTAFWDWESCKFYDPVSGRIPACEHIEDFECTCKKAKEEASESFWSD